MTGQEPVDYVRSTDMIKDLISEHETEVWICVCYNLQVKAPAEKHQLCLVQQSCNPRSMMELLLQHFWAKHVFRTYREVF